MDADVFRDTGQKIYDFMDLVLVWCPRCGKGARVVLRDQIPGHRPPLFASRRLVCRHCGLAKDWDGGTVGSTGITDPYFGLPLRLQTSCCGQILWAYNERHLDFLEHFVRAKLREAYPNGTLASRLPEWLKSAKNREEVLKCISKLREMELDDR